MHTLYLKSNDMIYKAAKNNNLFFNKWKIISKITS